MIKPVGYSEILDDPNWPALLAEYAAECSLPELGEASPQRDLYDLLEKSGGFQAFGVYDNETLVGFSSVLIYVLPHFGKKIASSESIFVAQPSGSGLDLIDSMKAHARVNECSHFIWSARVGSRFDLLLKHLHRHTNNVYLETL